MALYAELASYICWFKTMEHYPKFDFAAYFGVKSTADIPWGHAINSRELLAESLKADIMLGSYSALQAIL